MTDYNEIRGFIDPDGRLKQLPSKRKKLLMSLCFVAEKLPEGTYSESDFNDELRKLISFQDVATFRRELYDYRLIDRDSNGTNYRVSDERPSFEELCERYI